MIVWSNNNFRQDSNNKYSRYLQKYLSLLNVADTMLMDFNCTQKNASIITCMSQKSKPFPKDNNDPEFINYKNIANNIINKYNRSPNNPNLNVNDIIINNKIVYNKLVELDTYLVYNNIIEYILQNNIMNIDMDVD